MKCASCGHELCRDEIGLTRKLVNRAAADCYCFDCLGRQFKITAQQLKAIAEDFRKAGCTLFR